MTDIDIQGVYGSAGKTLLEALKEARILSVKYKDGVFRFREECDSYFTAKLTKEQVLMLCDELRALVEKPDVR